MFKKLLEFSSSGFSIFIQILDIYSSKTYTSQMLVFLHLPNQDKDVRATNFCIQRASL